MYLGRPWRGFSAAKFVNTHMDDVVRPQRWHNWNQVERERTARHAELGSTGPGANPSARVPWTRQLSEEEANQLTVKNVLAGNDGWDPNQDD